MRVMITGAAGFIAPFLAKHCIASGCSVLGIDHWEPQNSWPDAAFEHCNVRDGARFSELIAKFEPERIFHLAAQSYPTVSLARPQETFESNVGGTINLFESLRTLKLMPTVVVACSSAEYGLVASKDLPVRETHSLLPLHPYGVSKVAQDLLAAQYFANYGIPAIRIRIFNTTGPGKKDDVCSDLTKRAIEIVLGIHPPVMKVGNTTTRRAIIDVRDEVRGLWLAAEHCKVGDVYNLGAESIHSVQEIIEEIRSQLGVQFELEQEPSLVRACDEPVIAGDMTKFRNCCSWQAEIPLRTTIHDMLEWWRAQLAGSQQPVGSREA
jgi:GDP-4-dehydro-6-deoxy-D-mannose reductase